MPKHQATPDLEAEDVTLPSTIKRNEDTVRNGFWPKLQTFLARVPFAEKAVAAYYCAFDPDTPLKAKGILLAALAYFIMPIDVLPDVILGLGFTDDLTVLATAYGLLRSHIKPEHVERARQTLDEMRKSGEPPSA